jgi:hypothetical protein
LEADTANIDKNVESNPEEVFCRKVGEALSAGADFVDATFETIDVSFLFFRVKKLKWLKLLKPIKVFVSFQKKR